MSKPREFAHLIKNKFGSADNINQMAAREYYFIIISRFILYLISTCFYKHPILN